MKSLNSSLAGLIAVLLLGLVTACRAEQQGIRDYEQARQIFWTELYAAGGRTLYCARSFTPGARRGINIEHIMPMAWVTRTLACGRRQECRERSDRFNRIEADLHNLYPARRDINDARGSWRFGMVNGERRLFGRCDFELDYQQRLVEPRPAVRGEIARAMFYMQQEYGVKIYRRQAELLRRWHRRDPPDAMERVRNDRIERLQGNRNPFIDRPELVQRLQF